MTFVGWEKRFVPVVDNDFELLSVFGRIDRMPESEEGLSHFSLAIDVEFEIFFTEAISYDCFENRK